MQDASKQVRQLEKEQENASEKGIRASKSLAAEYRRSSKPGQLLVFVQNVKFSVKFSRLQQHIIALPVPGFCQQMTRQEPLTPCGKGHSTEGELTRTSETMSRIVKPGYLG
jgi:hypothetical protein